jgi:hypothetical protein
MAAPVSRPRLSHAQAMSVVGGGPGVSGETLSARGVQLTALSFAVAGLLFVLYPAIRPFSNEASLAGAQRWLPMPG